MDSFNYDDLGIDIDFEQVNSTVINKQDELRQRMVQIISKFASTVTARKIDVILQPNRSNVFEVPYNSAAKPRLVKTEAETIHFNESLIGDLNDSDVVLDLKGISLHEIGRILLTPRAGSNLIKWVRGNNYDSAFNALEDQRTETFLTAKYSNVKHWFTAMVTKYILDNPSELTKLFPLIHGRQYLPADLRKAIERGFDSPALVQEIKSIIDAYTVLNLSNSARIPEAQALIARFHAIINSAYKDSSKDGYRKPHSGWDEMPKMNGDGSQSIIKSSEKSKPMNKEGQDRIINKIMKERNNAPQNIDGDEEGEEYESESSDGQCGMPGAPGNGQGDGQGDGDDANANGEGNPNDIPGQGNPNAINNINDIAREQFNKSKNILREDINEMVSQFNGDSALTSKTQPVPSRSHKQVSRPVPSNVVAQVKSFTAQLELIRAQYDPGWLSKVNTGRLNVRRYATGEPLDEVFDVWDDGREDVVDIEAVVLLDNSGSMDWTIEPAHDSMWAIKRSLDKIGASTTVLTFSDDARLLYSSNERASYVKKYVGTAGGTNPEQAVDYAKYVFANSERAIKILIVITDGAWYGAEKTDRIIHQLKRAGVITALGYIDERSSWSQERQEAYGVSKEMLRIDGHGAEIVVPLTDGNSLLTLAKALVKSGIKRNLNK